MGYYDVQQVCLNGHQTTDTYNQSPEFRIEFCSKCGAKTIHKCPECNQTIRGDYHSDEVVVIGGSTPIPTHCEGCGRPFPWFRKKDSNILGTIYKKFESTTTFEAFGIKFSGPTYMAILFITLLCLFLIFGNPFKSTSEKINPNTNNNIVSDVPQNNDSHTQNNKSPKLKQQTKEKDNHSPILKMKPTDDDKTKRRSSHPIALKGRLKLELSPSDANVRFKSIMLNYFEDMELEPGDYQIIISKKGYNPKEIDIKIKPNETFTVKSNLDERYILLEFLFKTKNKSLAGTDDTITVIFSDSDEEFIPNTEESNQSIKAQFNFRGFRKGETLKFEEKIAENFLIASKYVRIVNSGKNCWKSDSFSLKIDGKKTIDEIITPNMSTESSNEECIQNYNQTKWNKRSYWQSKLPSTIMNTEK